jgi:hypothetical protein
MVKAETLGVVAGGALMVFTALFTAVNAFEGGEALPEQRIINDDAAAVSHPVENRAQRICGDAGDDCRLADGLLPSGVS